MIDNKAPLSGLDRSIADIRAALGTFTFRASNEADLQRQVVNALIGRRGIAIDTEVRVHAGRFDVLLTCTAPDGFYQSKIVLELKRHSAPAPVERQAQRYAMMDGIDAVGVVTTSARLSAGLIKDVIAGPAKLGGKPFFVITLRTS